MKINDLTISPYTLVQAHTPALLQISPEMDSRRLDQAEKRALLFGKDSGFDPAAVGLRFEHSINRLYISVKWLRSTAVEEGLPSDTYVKHLRSSNQYLGSLVMALLKGTGHQRPVEACLFFDMGRPETPEEVVQNRREALRLRSREHRLDPGMVDLVEPLLNKSRSIQQQIRANEVEVSEARRVLQAIKSERRRLERLKHGLVSDPRKRHLRNPARMRLAIVERVRALADDQLLMVRQTVPDRESPEGVQIISMDAVSPVLGLLKEDGVVRRIYLVVADLKKHIPNYRRDYRYTHSQTVQLKEIGSDGVLRAVNKHCAVFDLKRSAEEVSRD